MSNPTIPHVIVNFKSHGKLVAQRVFDVPQVEDPGLQTDIAKEMNERIGQLIKLMAAEGVIRPNDPKFAEGTEVWITMPTRPVEPRQLDLSGFRKLMVPSFHGYEKPELPEA